MLPCLTTHDREFAEAYKDSGMAKIEMFRAAVCEGLSLKPGQPLGAVSGQMMPLGAPRFSFAEVNCIANLMVHYPQKESQIVNAE